MTKLDKIGYPWMRMKELAERSGVSRHTIHYYLKEGLLPPPEKTGKTMALYTSDHLSCLEFIRRLREERKMPIAAIRQEVRLNFADQMRSRKQKNFPGVSGTPGKKGERQRRRIIETALEIFSGKGYHRAHVGAITDALKISKGTFYLYFENKHDLFVSVFDYLIDELTLTEERISGESDYRFRMRERALAYFSFYKKYHKIFDIIRAESIGQEGRPELSIQAIYMKIIDPLKKDIQKAEELDLIPKTGIDPELQSYMLLGSVDLLCYRVLMDDRYDFDDVITILARE